MFIVIKSGSTQWCECCALNCQSRLSACRQVSAFCAVPNGRCIEDPINTPVFNMLFCDFWFFYFVFSFIRNGAVSLLFLHLHLQLLVSIVKMVLDRKIQLNG